MPDKYISWDRGKLEEFKVVYNKALEDKVTEFKYGGNEYFVGYAKYLIEHLEGVLQ